MGKGAYQSTQATFNHNIAQLPLVNGIRGGADCGQGSLDTVVAVCEIALVCGRDDGLEGLEALEEGGHGFGRRNLEGAWLGMFADQSEGQRLRGSEEEM